MPKLCKTCVMLADAMLSPKLVLLLALVATFIIGAANGLAAEALVAGQIDIQQSRVYVHVFKTGFGHEHGVEGQLKSGWLSLSAPQNAGEIVFNMASFSADTDAGRRAVGLDGKTDAKTQAEVNHNMLGADVLDVNKFPTATFKIQSARHLPARRPNAPQQYELVGDFTLHGTTKSITVVADASPANGFVRLRGSFSVLQSDFGIKPFSKALGAVGVADRLTISGDFLVAAGGAAK